MFLRLLNEFERNCDMKLNVNVGDVQLTTPLLLGSGYITERTDFYRRAAARGCSGIVTRSLKLNVPIERQQVPAPRYAPHGEDSILNCEWGNEEPWESWRDQKIKGVREIGGSLVLSLSGRDIDGCAALITILDRASPDAYEVNVSCSHSGELHGNLNLDLDHLGHLLNRIRPLTERPIWIKLSYSSILLSMAKTAEECGADAIVCTNSIGPGLLIDTRTGKPNLGIQGGAGGLTGHAIFPIALQCVSKLSKLLSIPVVGVGGISTADHVVQMMMAGASAVQLYTEPALRGPRMFEKLVEDLNQYLNDHPEFNYLRDVVGMTHQYAQEHQFSSPPPIVIEENCTGCLDCVPACHFNAIRFVNGQNGKIVQVTDNCNGCNACVGVCPPEYNALIAST